MAEENVSMNIDETKTKNEAVTIEIDPSTPVTVNVGLLNNMRNIISVISDRGAIKASEMYGVGLIYNGLTDIISKVVENSKKSEGGDEPANN